jgi:hypothetical protein
MTASPRASLLDRLVAVSDKAWLRKRCADRPIVEIEALIRDFEEGRANAARFGRLHAIWLESKFELIDEADPADDEPETEPSPQSP